MNRLIPGLALALGWLFLLLSNSLPLFFLALFVIMFIGGHEYMKMAFPRMSGVARFFLASLVLFPLLGSWFPGTQGLAGGLLLSFFLLSLVVLWSYSRIEDPFLFFSRSFLGIGYVGVLGAFLLSLHHLPEGNRWLLILTAITAGSDTGAYYCGRRFGKSKLCPSISPNKTIEGAVGGMVAGTFGAVLMALLLRVEVGLLFLVPVALLLTCVGIVGDLTESVVKRATATKDSGSLLGGHGGVLDRVDSLLFAAPVLYYFLIWHRHVGAVIP